MLATVMWIWTGALGRLYARIPIEDDGDLVFLIAPAHHVSEFSFSQVRLHQAAHPQQI